MGAWRYGAGGGVSAQPAGFQRTRCPPPAPSPSIYPRCVPGHITPRKRLLGEKAGQGRGIRGPWARGQARHISEHVTGLREDESQGESQGHRPRAEQGPTHLHNPGRPWPAP
jgi:hypothetical protein